MPKVKQVKLRRHKLDALLGHHIETEIVTDIFQRLGFPVQYADDVWTVTSASWRFDIEIEEDLVEEVARIYGYNSIPNNAPLAHLRMREHKEADVDLSRIKTALVSCDFHEAITYSFVDPKIQTLLHPNQEALILPNPISSEMSAMRVSLLTGLLGAVLYNQNRQQTRVRLFEAGLRFIPDANAEFGVRQERVFSAVMTGARLNEHWAGKSENADFFDLKGYLEFLLERLNVTKYSLTRLTNNKNFHPGASAEIKIGEDVIGVLGELHPKLVNYFGIKREKVFFAELNLTSLLKYIKIKVNYETISKYPEVLRDLAITLDKSVLVGEMVKEIKKKVNLIEKIDIFDVYSGDKIDKDKKSVAMSIVLRDKNRTLTDEDIDKAMTAILELIKDKYNGEIRK